VNGLPDPSQSRAVLIGTSHFAKLESLPAVRNNLSGLAKLLRDDRVWGLPTKHCVVIEDPATNADMLDPVLDAAHQTIDTLVVYYAGHGLIDSRGELHLGLVGSDRERIYTAVSYNHVRDALLESRASRRIVVLDCCYSGRALGLMGDDLVSAVVDEASAEGTYILAATAENKAALAVPGEEYTAFTAELLATFRHGIAGSGKFLDLDAIFSQIRVEMRAKSRPAPQKRDRNTAGKLTLIRNRAYREPAIVASPRDARRIETARSSARPSLSVNQPGPRLLAGRYELDGILARGGTAEVFRARDIRLDRIVAVKTLREDLARDPTFQARFRREAQSVASLNHPSIVAVHDTGEDTLGESPVPYIVMEYVDGRTLRDLLRDDRRLLPERALEITDGVLRALDYSHRNGIVHRDIKPGNVMLTRTGEVKVMGFGIARAVSDAQATMTQTAQVIGTAQYLSPEQASGERVDARSDLYSTGCLLYELLTGRPPFLGDSPVAIAYQHVRENPVPPSQLDPDIPAWADSIVLRAMAKDPADRYQSAADMRTDIQRALSGVPLAGRRPIAANPPRAIPGYEYGPEDESPGRYLKKFTPRHRRSPKTPP
jgi:serine/threonine protein kinase